MTFMRKFMDMLNMENWKSKTLISKHMPSNNDDKHIKLHNISTEVSGGESSIDISDYNNLPIINTSQDKYASGGYIARKMLRWEHDFEECVNIFKGSNIPIVCEMDQIIRNINTLILQNPDGTIGRTVTEIFYCEISKKHQSSFMEMVNILNRLLVKYNLSEYQIDSTDIIFTRTRNKFCKYSLPLSLIIYNGDKNTFTFKFSNEIAFKGEYSTQYKNTKYGEIIYDENGILKKANLTVLVDNSPAKCKFKNYKTGFDLYEIRHNGSVIYKRNKIR